MSTFTKGLVSPTTNGSGTGLVLELTVSSNFDGSAGSVPTITWNASWTIVEKGDDYKVGDTITIPRPSGLDSSISFPTNGIVVTVTGISLGNDVLDENLNQLDAIADYVQIPGMEQKSHQDGPEHEIVYVNELINQGTKPTYMDLAIGGIRINSAKEWTNFTQLSAYFKKGIKVADLVNSPASPPRASSNFVEIAYALLTDSYLGAGELVGVSAVGEMSTGAKFCNANAFTWDGIISNKINLRDFLYEHGTYNLLDFTVIGGKFNLIPAVPYNSNYQIDYDAKIDVKALFTDGNIKDLQVSFLTPEERQIFKANVLYRKETENGFAETRSVMLRLKNNYGGSNTDPVETYDLSGFCTTKNHAEQYAKYILKLRKEIDHGLTFKTAPQYVVNLAPGDYFRLVSEASHVDRYENGVITADGKVISKDTITGSKDIYYWKPGTTEIGEATVNFSSSIGLRGVLFTLKNTVTSNRVYKLETISYAEDGLVEISGSHAPLTSTGSLAILDGWSGVLSHFLPLI
tara:strand:+ start:2792 stop:4345 length:1554 start_codon:yes stop_codon:yes gene_type:complete